MRGKVLDPADVYFLAGAGGRSRFLVSNAWATQSELLAALLHRHAGSVSRWLETL
jgi:hypothetical protein